MRIDVVKEAITHRSAGLTHASGIADAVISALSLLHIELSQVVGAHAAAALCAHAVHRTRDKIVWTMPPVSALSDKAIAELRRDLGARKPVDALFAGETLLLALADHLISLIGEPLTSRMLHSAWTASDANQISPEIIK